MKNTVFVYGTLKRGNFLSRYLESAEYIGEARSVGKSFRMFCNGHYPYVTSCKRGYRISGELYNVDSATLEFLDRVEKGYDRRAESFLCNGETVEAQLYVADYADDLLSLQEVTRGNWNPPARMSSPEKYFSEMSE